MNGSGADLNSIRAKKARLGHKVGKFGLDLLISIGLIAAIAAGTMFALQHDHLAYFLIALALLCFCLALWYVHDLADLPVSGKSITDRLDGEVLALLNPKVALTPVVLWKSLRKHWQVTFVINHLLISGDDVDRCLSNDNFEVDGVWRVADVLRKETSAKTIEPGHIAGALMLISPSLQPELTQLKLGKDAVQDVVLWLGRALETMRAEKPYFGGIGRDWANGFTPQLNRFGDNVSLSIEHGGSYFGWLTGSDGVKGMKSAFSQGSNAIALIGDDGIGKTSHVSALAKVLLEERHDRNLEHRQIIALDSSTIISNAQGPGEIEGLVVQLMNEAGRAGHIILFLDNAQLFFSNGTGSFDVTQILLPVLQSHIVQMVLAMTPHDYQQLRASHSAFANLLTPVMLAEPDEENTMRILEDTALGLEGRHKVFVTYGAVREAYRLSGRYEDNLAYPGKAIQLLTQAVTHAQEGIVTELAVQKAIEQAHGVKATAAAPVEASTLLNLEDKIHERMINQTRAVSVVSNALRRARAGVANPKRPFGSFMFLGPTGVGKTELAKAIAAVYFGAESNMIRLDMSEYQRPDDVSRLLSDGQQESQSLVLSVRQQPFSVVLLDEIEKAHPNVLNLLLQLLDEGKLTDNNGRAVSFKDCVIIVTSNAGAQEIRKKIEAGEKLEKFEPQLVDELINSGQFKPELLNRFDDIVVFRPLNQTELAQVVQLMLGEINQTLANQNIAVELTPAAIGKIVSVGYDPRLGARPMRRTLQRAVEDTIAQKILRGEAKAGDKVVLDVKDLSI